MNYLSHLFRMKLFAVILCLLPALSVFAGKNDREYYQITTYHFSTTDQEKAIDAYLEQTLVPALHKYGIKNVGVFKWLGNDTAFDKKIIMLIPLASPAGLEKLPGKNDFIASVKEPAQYIDATYDKPPYTSIETVLVYAFPMAPKMQLPKLTTPFADRVYELRSYESATEKQHVNKVHMFNEGGEVDLFKRLQFNAVFYGSVLAGSHMPNLMYMTTFDNMQERDKHWKAFVDDPQWKSLIAMPYYAHNVSHIDIYLMRPAAYSDY